MLMVDLLEIICVKKRFNASSMAGSVVWQKKEVLFAF